MFMKGFVYILKDENGKFYIGSTNNVARRLHQHANNRTRTTHRMKNLKLVLTQEYIRVIV